MISINEIRDRAKRGRATLDDAEALLAELDDARAVLGETWFTGGASLAAAIMRKCRMLEDDAEHWRKAAEARSLCAEDGDHVLHRFAAIAAAKNDGRSAITLTVWSDGTIDAEQYATLEGELDEWGTLHQERRASWGSRPIGELDALVDDLESDDWYTVEHRAPQDFWREIQALRARVAEMERDARLGAMVRKAVGCMNAYMIEGHTTAPGFTLRQERIISVHQLNVLRAIADALRAEEGGE